MLEDTVIQKVNDVRVLVLVKVLEWPGREVVKQAIATGEWVNLVIATYDNCVETTGAITLTGVHGFCDEPSGTFAFSGRFARVDVDDGIIRGSDLAVYTEFGVMRVTVDKDGAQLEFSLNLSAHFM